MAKNLEEFMAEHNRLSPVNLQVTKEVLLRFQGEKSSLFRDGAWSIEKMRRPFIEWLCAASPNKKTKARSKGNGWITFPRPAEENSGMY